MRPFGSLFKAGELVSDMVLDETGAKSKCHLYKKERKRLQPRSITFFATTLPLT
jgi:hypothetical protein